MPARVVAVTSSERSRPPLFELTCCAAALRLQDGTGRAVSKRSLQRFSESLGEVGKEVFMRAIVKPFAKDMAEAKAAKQVHSENANGVQADEGEAAEEEEDSSTLLLSVDQYWFYWCACRSRQPAL